VTGKTKSGYSEKWQKGLFNDAFGLAVTTVTTVTGQNNNPECAPVHEGVCVRTRMDDVLHGYNGDSGYKSGDPHIKTCENTVTTFPESPAKSGYSGYTPAQTATETPPDTDHAASFLSLPVRAASELPLKVSCAANTPYGSIWLTASRLAASSLQQSRTVVFTPYEYESLATAVATGRAFRDLPALGPLSPARPSEVRGWVERKRKDPYWRLTPIEALADAIGLLTQVGTARPIQWVLAERPEITFGELFSRLDWTLAGVFYDEDFAHGVPAAQQSEAA
jgi:hypothetical protein